MKRKQILTLAVLLSLSASAAFAAPPSDLEQGEAALHIGTSISPDMTRSDSAFGSVDLDADNRIFGGIAVGLGNRWSASFNYFENEGDLHRTVPGIADVQPASRMQYNLKIKSYDLNLHYKFSPYFYALLGYTHDKADGGKIEDFSDGHHAAFSNSSSHSGYQLGLTGLYPLDRKWDAWGTLAWGNKRNTQELGLSYHFDKNLRADLSYRWNKFKDFDGYRNEDGPFPDFDVKTDGLRVGLTYCF